MKIFLKFQPAKRQFYSPTTKEYYGRKKLGELIRNGTITEISYLGSAEEREAAIDFLMYKQQPTLHEQLSRRNENDK